MEPSLERLCICKYVPVADKELAGKLSLIPQMMIETSKSIHCIINTLPASRIAGYGKVTTGSETRKVVIR